jgi:hypothetical protein
VEGVNWWRFPLEMWWQLIFPVWQERGKGHKDRSLLYKLNLSHKE